MIRKTRISHLYIVFRPTLFYLHLHFNVLNYVVLLYVILWHRIYILLCRQPCTFKGAPSYTKVLHTSVWYISYAPARWRYARAYLFAFQITKFLSLYWTATSVGRGESAVFPQLPCRITQQSRGTENRFKVRDIFFQKVKPTRNRPRIATTIKIWRT